MSTGDAQGVETTACCWRTSADEFEGADPNKVLSYSPASTSKEYVAELVSMSEATLNWMRTFEDEVNELHFDTERRTVVVINCGRSDMWLTAVSLTPHALRFLRKAKPLVLTAKDLNPPSLPR